IIEGADTAVQADQLPCLRLLHDHAAPGAADRELAPGAEGEAVRRGEGEYRRVAVEDRRGVDYRLAGDIRQDTVRAAKEPAEVLAQAAVPAQRDLIHQRDDDVFIQRRIDRLPLLRVDRLDDLPQQGAQRLPVFLVRVGEQGGVG